MARCTALGSNGYETATAGTDIIERTRVEQGWTALIPTKDFEFYAKDDVEVSVNGNTSFTLLAGDKWTEKVDSIGGFSILTADAEYRYLAKF